MMVGCNIEGSLNKCVDHIQKSRVNIDTNYFHNDYYNDFHDHHHLYSL